MFRSPGFNEVLLKKHACLDDIYKAMHSSDLSDVVITTLDLISKVGTVPQYRIEKKSEAVSTEFRRRGNQAYMSKKYQEAFLLYNKALKYAPKDSKEFKYALSNRSALFITVKAFSACMGDIDMVIERGCPPEIRLKLEQRYSEAQTGMRSEDSYWLNIPRFANAYFKPLYEPRNPQISCATKNVGVIMENDIPKIVAVNDIKVGTVLAVEPAYVNHLVPENQDLACYYCHRLDYNLVPCDGCCHVLFCDEYCMHECMQQYHSVECKLMDLIENLECVETLRLALKAAIKMKMHSPSWKSLIAASKVYGIDRIKNNSISEIYDQGNHFSMLAFKDDRHLIHGAMYNNSFIIAAIIYYLRLMPGFFPDTKERSEAIKCFGRITMYLTLFGNPTTIANAASINDNPQIEIHNWHNYGFFSLTGKLRNSCIPNVMIAGLNDKVGLVALQPITRGTELTVTYVGHWLDQLPEQGLPGHFYGDISIRKRDMFVLYQTVCNCVVCSGDWKKKNNTLTPIQKACYSKIRLQETIDYSNLQKVFKNLCRAFSILHNVPFSKEYLNVYKLLRTCWLLLQHVTSENIVLERAKLEY